MTLQTGSPDEMTLKIATLQAKTVTISGDKTFIGTIFGADIDDLKNNIEAMSMQTEKIRRSDRDYLVFVGNPERC